MRRDRREQDGGGCAGAVEPPLRIGGLGAWFDGRRTASFSIATGISAWSSRAGSFGTIPWSQSTPANQPVLATAVATLNGQNAVQFDGVNDYMTSSQVAPWKVLHDGTGSTWWTVMRLDSTGPATQRLWSEAQSNLEIGIRVDFDVTPNMAIRISDGDGTQTNGQNGPAGTASRDVSRWVASSYATNSLRVYASGVSPAATADGSAPSAANPTRALIMGSSLVPTTFPLKGYVAQALFFTRVLSSTDLAQLALWARRIYGVST